MFTGIVEEKGKILSVTNNKISVSANKVLDGTKLGDSIAVNGACLTVVDIKNDCFTADVSEETLKITALNKLKIGSYVNLERAIPINGRLGGHIVSGHVDGIGKVTKITKNEKFYDFEFELNEDNSKYTVKKGSIAINGISLTIAAVRKNIITIAIIPHTYENTALQYLQVGDYVNIETDILAKYVEKFLSTGDNRTGISMEFLHEHGF